MIDAHECRMFPLGSVLLPGAPLPLHIFETRYQVLLNDTLEDDRRFGVVLISRGSEVGGGDERTAIGTIAEIEEHSRFDDGRAALVARGVGRLEVVDWLPDDPYPRATVVERPDAPVAANAAPAFDRARNALDELLTTARELGRLRGEPEFSWSGDVVEDTWQLATLAPLATLDRQRVLEADDVSDRLAVISEAINAITTDLRLMADLDD